MSSSDTRALLSIGQLAEQAGVGVETVRFYEREGLIGHPIRSANGYRRFKPEVINRFAFIKRSRELGFTLKEIRELLELSGDENATAGEFKTLAQSKIEQISEKIETLEAMRSALQKLTDCCPGGDIHRADCPILAALQGR